VHRHDADDAVRPELGNRAVSHPRGVEHDETGDDEEDVDPGAAGVAQMRQAELVVHADLQMMEDHREGGKAAQDLDVPHHGPAIPCQRCIFPSRTLAAGSPSPEPGLTLIVTAVKGEKLALSPRADCDAEGARLTDECS